MALRPARGAPAADAKHPRGSDPHSVISPPGVLPRYFRPPLAVRAVRSKTKIADCRFRTPRLSLHPQNKRGLACVVSPAFAVLGTINHALVFVGRHLACPGAIVRTGHLLLVDLRKGARQKQN